jgi:CMP-N,N'-diacetyllegionaminic acid synthase
VGSVIALIPARAGSKGVRNKNFRSLAGGPSCALRACSCAQCSGVTDRVVISADTLSPELQAAEYDWLERPAALAQDDTPMIDVVKHALDAIPGAPDDIWLLVQPTQPLRKPEHLREVVRLLRETQADSVVSVVELPRTHSPEMQMRVLGSRLVPFGREDWDSPWQAMPSRRQDAEPTYIRDGTVYVFWRKTVAQHGTIYGRDVRPLIIDPQDTCELDTPEQWDALEARLRRTE